ncbi:hypothetical protein HC891_04320 [Candidatus Gracilibacteria bacterium]|nr:hypothetical protein [Candidatus Gracilibacteria bacterium]
MQELSDDIFFVGKNNPNPVLQNPRSAHAVALLRGKSENPNETSAKVAWVYVAGGSGLNISDEEVETNDTLFVGRLGGVDEANATVLARTGWYYARAQNVEIQPSVEAEVLEFKWTTKIDRAALPSGRYYFLSIAPWGRPSSGSDPTAFDGTTWIVADGDPDR